MPIMLSLRNFEAKEFIVDDGKGGRKRMGDEMTAGIRVKERERASVPFVLIHSFSMVSNSSSSNQLSLRD